MRKFTTLALIGFCSLGAVAANQSVQETGRFSRQLKHVSLPYSNTSAAHQVAPKADDSTTAPESLIGKSYLTLYNDGDMDCVGNFTVTAGANDSIVLNDLAQGYSLTGVYDSKAGTITIPTNRVIATHSTYGPITVYALDLEAESYNRNPVVMTWKDGKFVSNYGFYGLVSAGALIFMGPFTTDTPNASATFVQSSETVTIPLKVTSDGTILNVLGLSAMTYGNRIQFPLTLNKESMKATAPFPNEVDKVVLSSGTRTYSLGELDENNYISSSLTLAVDTTATSSVLSNPKAFYGYKNGTSYSGYVMTDFKINAGVNVFHPSEEDTETDTPTIGGITYLINRTAGTAQVTGCVATLTEVNIPAEITQGQNKFTVVSVAKNAFMASKTITSVTIPASVKTIETDAFRNMSGLKTLNLPSINDWVSVTFANGNANPIYNVYGSIASQWGTVYFDGKALDANLVIPEGVTRIGRAFYGAKVIETVSLPSSLTYMGDQVFTNCEKITSVVIPAAVDSIGSAFYNCKALAEVTFKGAPSYLNNTFNSTAITEMKLPEGVEFIGTSTFGSCKSLKKIELPASLDNVGIMCFYGCSALEEITSKAVNPPTASLMAFDSVDKEIPVYVPEASIEEYQNASQWNDFTNYQPYVGTGVEGISSEDVDATPVYYNLQGVRVANPEQGLYIVVKGSKTSKVYVK